MSNMKTVVLSLGSALVGGTIVFGIISWNPALVVPAASFSENKTVKNQLSSPPTEKDIFKSMDQYQKNMSRQFDSFFNDDFFNQDDPFEAMRKFRQNMEQDIQYFRDHSFSTPFDSWFGNKFGGGTVEDFSKREDNDFIYYDINIPNVNGTTIDTKIENGYLTIKGQTKLSSSHEIDGNNISNQSMFSSTFSRTFPLPPDVDQEGMKMESEENKIVIKFPKKKI